MTLTDSSSSALRRAIAKAWKGRHPGHASFTRGGLVWILERADGDDPHCCQHWYEVKLASTSTQDLSGHWVSVGDGDLPRYLPRGEIRVWRHCSAPGPVEVLDMVRILTVKMVMGS